VGLQAAQGMYLTVAWYWNLNDQTRAWAKRFEAKVGRAPNFIQAADYSATMFYLNAVKATGTDDAHTVMKSMKSHKVNDFFAHGGYVRADGTFIHDMYLVQVKTPQESKSTWDLYKVVATLPGDEVYTKPADSPCKLLRQ
jgi:branched-chain amino acid transport system substrate-binding protein